ncbi:uncharacterized protein LOC118195830 [Stegodyphus dumicola]|uniref:uncharacterized protein LOC118188047 n=1 Tax=Stegodyphus dumicola TaxID=202533 RepID=UPI0015AD7E3C|nr:uncharacterized protein LOC118188047 [Stegodyphus dumicola]XP_035223055.1 uncharacterized protein LOC118195830 [Stegodyphus dumicola]
MESSASTSNDCKVKRHINLLDDEDVELNNPHRKKAKSFDLDLASEEKKTLFPSYSIHLGRNLVMELKEFRGSHYIGLSRQTSNNDIKNRFNIPFEMLDTLKQACEHMINHIKRNRVV